MSPHAILDLMGTYRPTSCCSAGVTFVADDQPVCGACRRPIVGVTVDEARVLDGEQEAAPAT